MSFLVDAAFKAAKLMEAHLDKLVQECEGWKKGTNAETFLIHKLAQKPASLDVQRLTAQLKKLSVADDEVEGGGAVEQEANDADVLATKIKGQTCKTWGDLMRSGADDFEQELRAHADSLTLPELKLLCVARTRHQIFFEAKRTQVQLNLKDAALPAWNVPDRGEPLDERLDKCFDDELIQRLRLFTQGLKTFEGKAREFKGSEVSYARGMVNLHRGQGRTGKLIESMSEIFGEVYRFIHERDTFAQFPRARDSQLALKDFMKRHRTAAADNAAIFANLKVASYFVDNVVAEQAQTLEHLKESQGWVWGALVTASDFVCGMFAEKDVSKAKRNDAQRLLRELAFKLSDDKDYQDENVLDTLQLNFRAGRELVQYRASIKGQTYDAMLRDVHDQVYKNASMDVKRRHDVDCRLK